MAVVPEGMSDDMARGNRGKQMTWLVLPEAMSSDMVVVTEGMSDDMAVVTRETDDWSW